VAFTVKCRFLGNASGSGDEREVSGFSTLTTPTQVSGPIRQVFTTTAPIDLVSVISGELVMLYVEAVSSGLFINPTQSTPMVTSCCFISEGAFSYNTFKSTTSVKPFAEAQTARAEADVWWVAVT